MTCQVRGRLAEGRVRAAVVRAPQVVDVDVGEVVADGALRIVAVRVTRSPVVAGRPGSPQLDEADRSADDGSGEYNPGVPVSDGRVQPVKMKVFRELADAAARDPNAPRAKRARKAPKKYDE